MLPRVTAVWHRWFDLLLRRGLIMRGRATPLVMRVAPAVVIRVLV